MSYKSAQSFVDKMKGDSDFRDLMSTVANDEDLMVLLKEKRYDFNQKDLIQAMAACMAEMDEMMGKQTL